MASLRMKRFPLNLWPAAIPPLLGLLSGVFIAPPLLWSDTATGLLSWRHYAGGGTWNTLALPDPVDIARTIETTVTWWSPGQAMPLGLLTTAGLPLGPAMLLLALISAIVFALGLALLSRDLGASESALSWIATGATGCWSTLYAFGMFNGGEIALIAVWPWIAWTTWKLMPHPVIFSLGLPILFLLGSFAKHSFAVYGLALLVFLWVEALRRTPHRIPAKIGATMPFVIAGLLYMIGRQFLFDQGVSPSDPGQIEHPFAVTWGFGAIAPVLAATGAGSAIGRIFFVLGMTFEEGWNKLSWPLLILSPLPLVIYAWLSMRLRPLERFAGVACLSAFAVLFVLMWRGGSISLEDRHYRPAAALLIAVIGSACTAPSHRLALWARFTISAIVIFGLAAMLQRHISMRTNTYPAGDGSGLADMPSRVLAKTREIAATNTSDGSLIYLPTPALGPVVPQGRLLVTDLLARDATWIASQHWHGRVPLLTLILPVRLANDGRAAMLRSSFVDYAPTDWTRRTIDDWDFWQARTQ